MTIGLYANYSFYKGWTPETFGTLSKHQSRLFKVDISPFLHGLHPSSRCIDIGFGNGILLSWLIQNGFQADGVEIIPELRHLANLNFPISTFFSALSSVPSDSYDCALLFDVLEHIPMTEIKAFLSEISRILKPSGFLLARVPNAGSPFGLREAFGDLTHSSFFTDLSLRQLTALGSFSDVRIYRPRSLDKLFLVNSLIAVWYVPAYLIRKAFRLIIEFLFVFLSYNNTRLSISPSFFVLLSK
jgi:SAM-dependent methyltransferase